MRAGLIGLALFACTNWALGQVTNHESAGALLEDCKLVNKKPTTNIEDMRIMRCITELRTVANLQAFMLPKARFCIPAGTDGFKLVAAAYMYLHDQPDLLKARSSHPVVLAYLKAFPCPKTP